jgi:hypothetical protein
MAWTQEPAKDPRDIGQLVITINDNQPDSLQEIIYSLTILDANDEIMTRYNGDLTPELTSAQEAAILAVAATVRTIAMERLVSTLSSVSAYIASNVEYTSQSAYIEGT